MSRAISLLKPNPTFNPDSEGAEPVNFTLCIMKFISHILLLLVPIVTLAAPPTGVWHSPDRVVIKETDARRSVSGFGIWLVATPDKDWQEK